MGSDTKNNFGTTNEPAVSPSENSTRARNRTVMMTPEMTGQMRARLTPTAQQATLIEASDSEAELEEAPQEFTPRPFQNGFSQPEVEERTLQEVPPAVADDDDDSDWVRPVSSAPEDEEPSIEPEFIAQVAPVSATPVREVFSPMKQPQEIAQKTPSQSVRTTTTGKHEIVWRTKTPLAGFLICFDDDAMGDYLELRTGRIIVTSEHEGSGNALVIDDPSVSAMHAIMRVSIDAPVQILDQLSESGTIIRRCGSGDEEMLSGEKSLLNHGDVVLFGERKYHVCLITGDRTQ